MPTLQELERPIDEQIVNQLIEATPEWWKSAILEIEFSPKSHGIEGYKHTITNPDGHKDIVQAPDTLFESTFQLADVFRKHGRPWQKVIYTIRQSSKGDWNYSVDFNY